MLTEFTSMSKCQRRCLAATLLALVLACTGGQAFAQAGGGGAGGAGGGAGGRGGFDPNQFRQMMLDRIKEQLGAKDDEWKVLQPRLEKVMEARQETMMAGMGGMGRLFRRGGGAGGPGGPPAAAPQGDNANLSPLAKAAQDLQAATDDPNMDSKEVIKRMAAFREARDKAHANLVQAQKDLKELLTAKQEAVLLGDGLID